MASYSAKINGILRGTNLLVRLRLFADSLNPFQVVRQPLDFLLLLGLILPEADNFRAGDATGKEQERD
jgi:hypothetical protein